MHSIDLQQGNFIPFSRNKGSATEKLIWLQNIKDIRLKESLDSFYHMENSCSCIPERLEGIDLELYGYHRSFYQTFTKNLDRLKYNLEVDEAASTSRSPCKLPKLTTQMFPPQCTFCDKLLVKASGKTERCNRFPVYKNLSGGFKEPTWKQIEPRALELGLYRLQCKVAGEDLSAKQANFHPSCRKSFNLQYVNHMQKQQSVGTDANQDDKTAAHQSAFSVVLEFVPERVIGHHEIAQLSLLRELYVKELHGLNFPNLDYRNRSLNSNYKNRKYSTILLLPWS